MLGGSQNFWEGPGIGLACCGAKKRAKPHGGTVLAEKPRCLGRTQARAGGRPRQLCVSQHRRRRGAAGRPVAPAGLGGTWAVCLLSASEPESVALLIFRQLGVDEPMHSGLRS